jgi:DNA-binding NtrC family response regulator
MLNIVILDPNPASRQLLSQSLRELQTPVDRIREVDSLPAALETLSQGGYDLVFADAVAFPAPADLVTQFEQCPGRPFIVGVAAPNQASPSVETWGFVPDDLLVRPVDPVRLEWLLREAGRQRRWFQLNRVLWQELNEQSFLGESQPVLELRRLVRKVARTSATVLICGPVGSGKRLVAAEIFRQSARSQGPVVCYDCTQHAADRVDRDLFGTDGNATHPPQPGILEWLQGGTLILEEIAELPESVQQRLLHFLQNGQWERGGAWPVPTLDVRVLATTSRNLEELVARRRFNEELYLRLNILPITVPPLASRREDIGLLAEHFRQQATRRFGVDALAIAPASLRALQQAPWPGNARELRAAVERAVLACPAGGILGPEQFGLCDPGDGRSQDGLASSAPPPDLHEVEKRHIMQVLSYCGDNRTAAARVLGISIRTLRNKLREYREAAAAAKEVAVTTPQKAA